MAKQKGILKLDGTIDDITFFKSRDGYLAKAKGGVPAARIANDASFQRTRENGAEFGEAGKAGKLLRNSMRSLLQNASDRLLPSRMTTKMLKVVQADTTSVRGKRNVVHGDVNLLQGFDFNINALLNATFHAPFTGTIDRAGGKLIANLPPFIPMNMLIAPGGTTHFRIVTAGAEVDFANGKYVVETKQSDILPLNSVPTAVIELVNVVTAGSANPLFLALGVEFYQLVNGLMYPLKSGSFNSLSLINVSHL